MYNSVIKLVVLYLLKIVSKAVEIFRNYTRNMSAIYIIGNRYVLHMVRLQLGCVATLCYTEMFLLHEIVKASLIGLLGYRDLGNLTRAF